MLFYIGQKKWATCSRLVNDFLLTYTERSELDLTEQLKRCWRVLRPGTGRMWDQWRCVGFLLVTSCGVVGARTPLERRSIYIEL